LLAAALPLLAVPSLATAADVHLGIGVTVGRPSYRPGYGYGRRPVDPFRYGYDRGRTEGARDGFHDGEKGNRFEMYREGDYRDTDQGYKGWMGPRYEYANGYRSGYEQGYRQAFQQGRDRRRGHYDDRYYDRRDDRDDDLIYEVPRRRW
jgi:hypothetical protein